MIEFINVYTGTRMWVADNRKDEYVAAGHRPVALAEKPTEAPAEQAKPKAARKAPAKKTAK